MMLSPESCWALPLDQGVSGGSVLPQVLDQQREGFFHRRLQRVRRVDDEHPAGSQPGARL